MALALPAFYVDLMALKSSGCRVLPVLVSRLHIQCLNFSLLPLAGGSAGPASDYVQPSRVLCLSVTHITLIKIGGMYAYYNTNNFTTCFILKA